MSAGQLSVLPRQPWVAFAQVRLRTLALGDALAKQFDRLAVQPAGKAGLGELANIDFGPASAGVKMLLGLPN